MTYAKNSTITAIHRPITNGMYNDTYTVIYSNGIRRNYTIKGTMNKKHFEFIQSATVESRYSKHTGKHTSDVFTAPVEPQEEPATEEPTTEETKEEPTTEEETNEEPQQEKKNMTAFRDFLTIMTKERNGEIQADCDAEYTVKNATDEKAATKYALEKLLKALEIMGTKAAETVADIIRMNLKNDEFTADCNFNEIQNGGNAYEIEINPGFSDNTLWIYIRIAEYMHEEPAADQEPEEETTENYVAWCGMIENDVITDEFETLSEAVDEVETRYNKDEMKAAGITFCKLLCNSGQWLECLDEKTVDDVYYF